MLDDYLASGGAYRLEKKRSEKYDVNVNREHSENSENDLLLDRVPSSNDVYRDVVT